MVTKNRIEAISKQAETEGVIGDIKSVLQQTLTVGDLIKVLQQFNAETPVEVEIPVEIDQETDEMFSEVGFVIDAFLSEGASIDGHVLTLRACKPDMLAEYKAWLDAE